MQPCKAWPSEHQEPSEHNKEDECEMSYEYDVGERSIDQAAGTGMLAVVVAEVSDGEGPADESNLILSMIASNLGSPRSGSTIGCTRRYAAQPRRSSTVRSIHERALSFSPSAMYVIASSTDDTYSVLTFSSSCAATSRA